MSQPGRERPGKLRLSLCSDVWAGKGKGADEVMTANFLLRSQYYQFLEFYVVSPEEHLTM